MFNRKPGPEKCQLALIDVHEKTYEIPATEDAGPSTVVVSLGTATCRRMSHLELPPKTSEASVADGSRNPDADVRKALVRDVRNNLCVSCPYPEQGPDPLGASEYDQRVATAEAATAKAWLEEAEAKIARIEVQTNIDRLTQTSQNLEQPAIQPTEPPNNGPL